MISVKEIGYNLTIIAALISIIINANNVVGTPAGYTVNHERNLGTTNTNDDVINLPEKAKGSNEILEENIDKLLHKKHISYENEGVNRTYYTWTAESHLIITNVSAQSESNNVSCEFSQTNRQTVVFTIDAKNPGIFDVTLEVYGLEAYDPDSLKGGILIYEYGTNSTGMTLLHKRNVVSQPKRTQYGYQTYFFFNSKPGHIIDYIRVTTRANDKVTDSQVSRMWPTKNSDITVDLTFVSSTGHFYDTVEIYGHSIKTYGQLINQFTATCVDSPTKETFKDQPLDLIPCEKDTKIWLIDGEELRDEENNCIDSDGDRVFQNNCDKSLASQKWSYSDTYNQLKHSSTGLCLEGLTFQEAEYWTTLKSCDTALPQQIWTFLYKDL